MSLVALLRRTATIHHRAVGAPTGEYNAPAITETVEEVRIYVEQASRTEDSASRETSSESLRAIFEPGVRLGPLDTVEVAGVTYEVVGIPAEAYSARNGQLHHIEASLAREE